jgi:hypothetical protein
VARTTRSRNKTQADEAPVHICLAYQLGGLPCLFLSAVNAMWVSAREGEPQPPAIQGWAAQLDDLVERLAQAAVARLARQRDAVRRAVQEFLTELNREWDGPTHRELVEWYDAADPEPGPNEWPKPPIAGWPS